LCSTGVVYARRVDDRELTFIVSGMLWRESLVMMDRETETLWSHVTGEALRGPLAGKRLTAIPVVHTTWGQWKKAHPETLVLAKSVAVQGSAYDDYQADPSRFGLCRAASATERLPGKTLVHGTVIHGSAVAMVDGALEQEKQREAEVAGHKVIFRRLPDGGTRAFEADTGKELPVTQAYWFAWIAFYPGTELIESEMP
jgi:hypothetical protein